MTVRKKILLLLLFVAAAFVAGLVTVRRWEAEKFTRVLTERRQSWQRTVSEFLDRNGAPLAKMVEHLSTLEGAVPAVLARNVPWAREAWDEKTLSSYSANALWVYQPDGTLFYTRANADTEALQTLPIPPEALVKLFARSAAPHFYFALPGAGGLRLVEVRGWPVRPAWDLTGQTKPEAYFFGGRVWDRERLAEMPLLSRDDRVELRTADEPPLSVEHSEEAMTFVQVLADWKGRPLARLLFINESPALVELDARGERLFWALVAGAMALFVGLFFLLSRSIVHPLQLIIHGLHTRDLAPLAGLQQQNSELGELARLIGAFFQQRADLVREMTERVATQAALIESEEMLRHSQKMEAVGRLAGGVAHDFNNLLTAIIGYANLLTLRLGHDPVAMQEALLINQAGEQAAGLTRQLLAFSRKQLLQPKIIDLNLIVSNLHKLLQRIIGEHIEIRTLPEATMGRVKADPGQIEQVIVNLGVNARDAMPRGGQLTIRTVNLSLARDEADELPVGDYVAIEVTDSGEGMDAETKSRIFEPFFTTKGPGKGTGLGLATVYGIVKQSHGGIVVESERGRGSTFRILLPRDDAPLEQTVVAVAQFVAAAQAETILVVEDEEIVRELVCEVLRGHGYRVWATDRGTEAVRLVQEEAAGLHLLISDVVMPEMNGSEVAQRVRAASPGVKVLFVSGYSENDMADQGLAALSFEVLQKPFTPATLAAKVREVLDGRAG